MARRSRLAARREESGWTQRTLAAYLRVGLRTVRNWELGTSAPYPRHRRPLAAALRVDLDGLADLLVPDDEDSDTVEDVDRREFIAASAAAIGAVTLAPTDAFGTSRAVAPELPALFAAQLAQHYMADTTMGSGPLLAAAVTQHDELRRAAAATTGALRTDVLSVQAAYAGFVGWLHQDAGRLGEAHSWCDRALGLAHRSGDPNLIAYALASLSFVHLDARDAPAAVDLAAAALAQDPLRKDARLYSLRHAAHAHSLAEDNTSSRETLDESVIVAADSGGDDPYSWGEPWWATPHFLSTHDAQAATCYGRLGHHREAADLWGNVLAHHPPTPRRDRGVYATRYATSLLHTESPTAALAPTTEAVDCYQHAGSARMRRELHDLRTLAAYHDAGQELHELLLAV